MTVAPGEQAVKLVKVVGSSTHTVYIESAKVDEILVNKMIKIPRPIVKADQDTRNFGTVIVDLKQIEHVFNIQGYLSAETGSGNEDLITAKAVKDELITNILSTSDDIQLHYRDYSDSDYGEFYGDGSGSASTTFIRTNLDKVQITDAALRSEVLSGVTIQQAYRYAIQINLTRGKIK